MARRRYAVVGTGARAERHVRAIAVEHAATCELVAFADVNHTRMAAHNERLAEPVPGYDAADFLKMLHEQRVDVVVVTTVDRFHDTYIVEALDAGCDVVTEKPMTTDVASADKILDAVDRNDGTVTVTFNYRYNPIHEKVRSLLADGAVGEIGSVHFEWLLDTRHGADYFRRWHRDKANSGGLLVHKATHHFDLLNWWVGSVPETVYAQGRLFFYGDENGARHGNTDDDRFDIELERDEWLKKLYVDARHEDGYRRDQNPFEPGVSIEDDMSVLVRYASGANLTYHLTAYSPWEGYRLMVNGSRGRLELEVVESSWVSGQHPAVHGASASPEQGWAKLSVQRLFGEREDVPLRFDREGHGGADRRMVDALYGPAGQEDPLGRRATHHDGVLSLLTGFAANRSIETGEAVRVAGLMRRR
ncbi:Gfo/Idh/MocA family protein [Lentzea sp. NPDC059081]|uniref:Gfo/Idh/MocA family protein n=1 Tax=Lentzea sp. NPDC059081 TaxID=3346719 RepID=UPI00368A5839